MDKEQIQKALEQLKKEKKRKFSQSYDLIINLKSIDPKTNPLDFVVNLPFPATKKLKVGAFVDRELAEQAGKFCDLVIKETDFSKYNEKKELKRLAKTYNYFVAQANLMPKVAQVFGKALGTKGKMPNPKLGCVIPPNANMELLIKRLNSMVKLSAKKATNLQGLVGKEDQPDNQVIENILMVYQTVLKQLPQERHNIKNVKLKLTMSKAVKIG